jgi:exodeoxyribonuclease V alpha subunit
VTAPSTAKADERRVGIAIHSTGALRSFNEAGVLVAADVQVARYLARLGQTDDELVMLGTALAVRAPRLGHTCVDLATIRETADADVDAPVDIRSLPWPDSEAWCERLVSSGLVGGDRPLRLEGTALYLDRYWSDECAVAADLLLRAATPAADVDLAALKAGSERVLGGTTDPLQKLAAVSAVLRLLTVVAGGPGTGKTTTVARILALLDGQALAASGGDPAGSTALPLIALAAPTGKAAARLGEAVRDEAASLDVEEQAMEHLVGLEGTTLHRLLGRDPRSSTRFRHNRFNPLPHDIVVVDETSMVPLSMMARLVESVRPDARLILVGDPQQLASVEAGAVLGDVVGPATSGMRMSASARKALAQATDVEVEASDPPALAGGGPTPIGDGIIVLERVHRFGESIALLADAIRSGRPDEVLRVLSEDDPAIGWIEPDAPGDLEGEGGPGEESVREVRGVATDAGRRVFEAALAGDAAGAISALGSFRLLCAVRRGPAGALTWASRVEGWMAAGIDGFAPESPWYVGRPLLVTSNDYSLGLYNGDAGVVVSGEDGHRMAAFERGAEVVMVSPSRLESVETVYAMTVHKSQGSQFDTVVLVLPAPDSPILTRELFYTAVTRARERVVIVGSEASVCAAVATPIARSSGLHRRLWGE